MNWLFCSTRDPNGRNAGLSALTRPVVWTVCREFGGICRILHINITRFVKPDLPGVPAAPNVTQT